MSLKIFLFGNPHCEQNGQPLVIRRRKGMALLAYLVQTGQPHSREALATLFWPEYDRANALKNFRRELARLKQDLGADLISADRQSIRLNPTAEIQLDVAQFTTRITQTQSHQHAPDQLCTDCHTALTEAVDLYTADFMSGFTLPDCPDFDEWQYFQTDSLHQSLGSGLQTLIQWHNGQGAYDLSIVYGRRWLALDPLHEPAQRLLMQIYAWADQQTAALRQYQECVRLLDEELDVAPEAETIALYNQIQAGAITDPVSLAELPPKLPPFLQSPVDNYALPVFVSRERPLAQLKQSLAKAVAGQGQVMFIEGSAGRGKTALASAFAHQAQADYDGLLVAWGHCNAFAGIGDPYLPFRDIMRMLTGDVAAKLAAGIITVDQATRLWRNLLPMTQTLLDHGPNLIDVLVAHKGLLARVKTAVSTKANRLTQFQRLAAHHPADSGSFEQTFLFQQLVNVLQTVSAKRPLLLILDDLQWADITSISLLFHLGRRLTKNRILILGTYRPEEVALPRDGQRHPLQPLLTEFKRTFGDLIIDLGYTDERQGLHFIDDYLDAEPNQLSSSFRQTLFQHTHGHPLFTVELLQAMQERGNLLQNESGEWMEGDSLNWQLLPTRVEAVIEERIGRLEEALRQLLAVASVDGEAFTGQVVARVQALDERQVLMQLSQKVARHHRLVRERGERQVGDHILSIYQFAHALFQRYLYDQLSAGERRLLHAAVGDVLETLYAGKTETIAVQLARHFQEANILSKARHYLHLAGEQAAAAYANDEAVAYFSRALALLPETAVSERFDLLLAREAIYYLQGNTDAQGQDLTKLAAFIQRGYCLDKQAEIALRRAKMLSNISDFSTAILAAKEAYEIAKAHNNVAQEAAALLHMGEINYKLSDYKPASRQLDLALSIAKANQLRLLEGQALYHMGRIASDLGEYAQALSYLLKAQVIAAELSDRMLQSYIISGMGVANKRWGKFDEARSYYEQALTITREIGDVRGEGYDLNNLAILVLEQGDFAKAHAYHMQGLDISHKMGDMRGLGISYTNLGAVAALCGDYQKAKTFFKQGLAIAQELGHRRQEALGFNNLGDVAACLGEYDEAQQYLQQSLSIHQELNHRSGESFTLAALGRALAGAGKLEEAAAVTQTCIAIRRELGHQAMLMETVAILARIRLIQEHKMQALDLINKVLAYLDNGGTLDGTEEPLNIYLISYRVLQSNDDARAPAILQIAYDQLQVMAAKIPDEPTRRSFLENVPWHREIIEICSAND
ncbi:MAG: tetratricopeptide repeat protein [Chloroflexi bacterium]|nr:tetratricopeptide repeat protein [Chloroflexota bacterium]